MIIAAAFLVVAVSSERDPGVRNAHSLFFDGTRIVLFGGADAAGPRNDTWGWDGREWTRLAVGGPPPRTFAATAEDSAQRRAFLFGGNRVLFGNASEPDSLLGDFWIWDGSSWGAIDAHGPQPRAEAALAFDSCRQRLVLTGGYRFDAGKVAPLGDTWEWDGRDWKLRAITGPSARHGAAIAFDAARCRTVLFGGDHANAETWEWNGSAWALLEGPTAPGRYNAAMTYDASLKRLFRFGGWDGERRVGDAWIFVSGRWRPETGPAPPARNHSALAYDAIRRRLVLFGGHDGTRVFGDVWEHVGDAWRLVHRHRAERRLDNRAN